MGNLGSMAAMMVLPWALLEASNTPVIYAYFVGRVPGASSDLSAHPKRYAITSTHLFADSQRYRQGATPNWPSASRSDASCCCAMDGARLDHCLSVAHLILWVLPVNTSRPWSKPEASSQVNEKASKRQPLVLPCRPSVMEWTRSGDDLFVRLDPGEEIHASLQGLADEVGFDAAPSPAELDEPETVSIVTWTTTMFTIA